MKIKSRQRRYQTDVDLCISLHEKYSVLVAHNKENTMRAINIYSRLSSALKTLPDSELQNVAEHLKITV